MKSKKIRLTISIEVMVKIRGSEKKSKKYQCKINKRKVRSIKVRIK